ncbi:hypothetical protein B1R27_31605, partial [Streptomyces sp. GKU 895]
MKSEGVPRWASALDAVVVYAQGALCSRLARGTVPPGGRVLVTGLPRTVDPGSVRARVTGDSGARVTSVRVEVEAEPADEDSADELRQERERLEDACAAARERHERLLHRIREITELRPVPPPRKRDDPDHHRRTPAEAWLTLADFVDERLTRLHERLAESEEELRRLEHDLAVAVDRCQRASTAAPSGPVRTTVCAAVTLDGGTGEVDLEIEYGVPGAVWVPAYRLACRQADDSGTLVLRAAVAQRTGEDWSGVRIALATADLGRGTELPRLRSLRIGRRQPAPEPSGWREPPAGLADLFTAYDAAGPRPAPPSAPVSVAADAYGAAVPPVPPSAAPVPPGRPAYGGRPPAPAPAAPGGLPAPVAAAPAAQPRRVALHSAPRQPSRRTGGPPV